MIGERPLSERQFVSVWDCAPCNSQEYSRGSYFFTRKRGFVGSTGSVSDNMIFRAVCAILHHGQLACILARLQPVPLQRGPFPLLKSSRFLQGCGHREMLFHPFKDLFSYSPHLPRAFETKVTLYPDHRQGLILLIFVFSGVREEDLAALFAA